MTVDELAELAELAGTTVVVRGSGGGIVAMDVPRDVHGLERFANMVAKGDLAIVDPATVEEVEVDGARKLVLKAPAAADEPKGRKAKGDSEA